MRRSLSVITLLASLLPAAAQAEPLKVIASFSILGDMVTRVGGDAVTVTTLVGPDGDAHVYEPKPTDAKAVAAAGLVIFNGLGFEPWSQKLIKASGYKGTVVQASAGIKPQTMDTDEHGHGHGHGRAKDPHAWQSLANGRLYVANITAALSKAAPAEAGRFAANAAAYDRQLADLDAWVKAELAKIPRLERKVITGHDAFGYFASTYGVDMLSPVGISTEAEPSPRDIVRLIKQMKAQNVKVVFMENMSDPRLVQQIARDAGGVVGGTLYADALSGPTGPAASYDAMFRYNVSQLMTAWGQR